MDTTQQVSNLCNKLGRKDWVMHCVKPYGHGSGIAKYLARYIRGGAIKNSQIVHVGKYKVRFRYKSHQTQQTQYLSLSHEQFMQRLLSHVVIPKKPQYQLFMNDASALVLPFFSQVDRRISIRIFIHFDTS